MERMKKTGFYIIKDRFFEDTPDPYLKGNKAGNSPHDDTAFQQNREVSQNNREKRTIGKNMRYSAYCETR